MAMHIGIGNFSGAIASNIFRSQDAPRYVLGRKSLYLHFNVSSCTCPSVLPLDGLELMFVGIGLICVPLAVLLYTRINKQRDAYEASLAADSEKVSEGKKGRYGYTPQELRELGDRAPDFRYML
jgi:MFS transporter, ACS family, DAL5 transporter family protein